MCDLVRSFSLPKPCSFYLVRGILASLWACRRMGKVVYKGPRRGWDKYMVISITLCGDRHMCRGWLLSAGAVALRRQRAATDAESPVRVLDSDLLQVCTRPQEGGEIHCVCPGELQYQYWYQLQNKGRLLPKAREETCTSRESCGVNVKRSCCASPSCKPREEK